MNTPRASQCKVFCMETLDSFYVKKFNFLKDYLSSKCLKSYKNSLLKKSKKFFKKSVRFFVAEVC